ncbi:unnamed protein product (macronuclear) [Paramecium tetraurelia]|uniref:Uncharacterized protein n=1 Tax=Paramecium tetraurelia TaxID=5888 RepID=A0D790_PARTE|nr:uncharacterized protein GSPATT00001949001 [Paramecium tetraurelia]CAK78907.1 unnamed protein product [Paramecium tetraurelia]|eukprot:XP_001446304.1 hypothetical protein (macronuclear) [Paramecium tetraurelia strain d4-2]
MMPQQSPFQTLFENIIGQMKRGESQSALIEIDRQLKKTKFNQTEKKQLQLLKGSILVQIGALGDATKILNDNLNQAELEVLQLYSNLCKDLNMMNNYFEKFKPQNLEQTKEFYSQLIQAHRFQEASTYAIKIFRAEGEKNQEYMMEYIVQLSQKEDMGGKIVEMFVDKVAKNIKLENNLKLCTNEELGAQLIKFQLKFYQNNKNKNVDKVQQILDNHGPLFVEYQQNAAISLWIYQNNPTDFTYEQTLKYHYQVYNSLATDQILINFECQEQLVLAFYTEPFQLEIEQIEKPFQIVPKDKLLSHIYNSCQLLLKTTTNSLALKQLILISLKIINLSQNPKTEEILKLVELLFQQQGDKYTFCTELFRAIPKLQLHKEIYNTIQKVKTQSKSKEAETIAHINLKKLEIYISEEPIKYLDELVKLYNSHPVPEKVEKGDRLLQDEYLMIAIDILFDVNDFEKILRSLELIDLGLKNSPYNFDFLFRQIILLCELGQVEQAIESLTRLDIKGVQFETLGMTFAKSFLEFGGNLDQVERKNQQALIFYLENVRESKKNLLTSFKMKNYVPFESFHQFENWISNSYIKLIYYFVQCTIFNERQKQQSNVEYFCQQIQNKLKSASTFSIQETHFQSYFIREFSNSNQKYDNYIGIYKSQKQLLLETLFLTFNNEFNELKNDIQQVQSVFNVYKEIVNVQQNYNEAHLNYRNKLENQSLQIKYLEDYNEFINLERELRLSIARFYISLYQPQNDIPTNDFLVDLSKVQDLQKIIQKILNGQEMPTNSVRILNRFYKHTFPVLIVLIKQQAEIKQKLFSLQKKAQGDSKNILEKAQKQIAQTLSSLKDELVQSSTQQLMFIKNELPSQIKQQLNKTINNKELIQTLESNLQFQALSIQTMIEEKLKQMK